jgi:hypothetical protein
MPLTTAGNMRGLLKVQQAPDYAALRWNDGEFLNIIPGKTHLRTFLYPNILVEVWAIPALGIRALFL